MIILSSGQHDPRTLCANVERAMFAEPPDALGSSNFPENGGRDIPATHLAALIQMTRFWLASKEAIAVDCAVKIWNQGRPATAVSLLFS